MKDLNRYVIRKYATDWYNIGIELGLEPHELDIIENDNHQRTVNCFQKTLTNWLNSNTNNATWKTLETALTNVKRAKCGLDPIEFLYSKEYYSNIVTVVYVSDIATSLLL